MLEALAPHRVSRAHGQDLESWLETLPFPLASILWSYDGEPDPAPKVSFLLKFFEALAQFQATVLLSACIADDTFRIANWHSWFGESDRRSLALHHASFGTWVELAERLAVTLRNLRKSSDGPDRCRTLFAATDLDLADALISTELAKISRHARDRRNTWSGHDGVAGMHVQSERLRELEDLLGRTQALLGFSFETWTLLKPTSMTYSQGIFDATSAILKGPNPAFRRKRIPVKQPLDASRLYLLNDGNLRALELVPFMRVLTGSTGQDACYFFSRAERSDVWWVSYHFQAEPQINSPDDELVSLLGRLGAQDADADTRRSAGSSPRHEPSDQFAPSSATVAPQELGSRSTEPTVAVASQTDRIREQALRLDERSVPRAIKPVPGRQRRLEEVTGTAVVASRTYVRDLLDPAVRIFVGDVHALRLGDTFDTVHRDNHLPCGVWTVEAVITDGRVSSGAVAPGIRSYRVNKVGSG